MTTASPRHASLLVTTSVSTLAYEILLMRLFSIGQWHDFAYMAISIALLGFGASGSFIFLLFDRLRKNLDMTLIALSGLTALSLPLAFSLSQKIGLDALQLIWQSSQWLKMLIAYLLMAIPFMFAGGIVGIILTGSGEDAHRMYAVDLLGAGTGALGIVPALYASPPWMLLPALSFLLILGSIWICLRMRHIIQGMALLLSAGTLVVIVCVFMPPTPVIHPSKGLPMTLAFPDARLEIQKEGPLGLIDVVGSRLIRHVPGLSLRFGMSTGEDIDIPEQKAIFVDADGLSPVTAFNGDLNNLEYLDFTSLALPYHVRKLEKVLVLGAGGGADILLGLRHRVPEIIALEANQQITDLLLGPLAPFSGDLYSRPEVGLKIREARQFLHSTRNKYDLIQLSLTDSFVNASGGLHSATESYLYTVEAFKQYLDHLTGRGLLSVTRWLKLPPRDSLRIISTALSALRMMNLSDRPEKHLLFIRSWKTTTILVSKTPFAGNEIMAAREFCRDRGFDMSYYAGMRQEEANIYDVQDSPYYFNGASALCGPGSESFLNDYVFDVSSTTDNRPFFSHFFKWKSAPAMFRQLQREWFSVVEMGFFFILASLAQVTLAGLLLILLPLLFLRKIKGGNTPALPRASNITGAIIYFGCIGVGFMFLEIAFLPRFTLLLSHPVYAAAVVLSAMLVFAGFGSLTVRRIEALTNKGLWISVSIITCWVIAHHFAGDRLFDLALGLPFAYRLALSIILISVPSFFLGWPFPTGLRFMSKNHPGLVPWAWGINGCASVIGAVLAKCIAVSMGFKFLMSAACIIYFLAAFTWLILFRSSDRGLQQEGIDDSLVDAH